MALILNHFYSSALTECNSMTVIAPVETWPDRKFPVLWLLPPVGMDSYCMAATYLDRRNGREKGNPCGHAGYEIKLWTGYEIRICV